MDNADTKPRGTESQRRQRFAFVLVLGLGLGLEGPSFWPPAPPGSLDKGLDLSFPDFESRLLGK